MKQGIMIIGSMVLVYAAWQLLQPGMPGLSTEQVMNKEIRKATVAGRFYPGSSAELVEAVDAYLDAAGDPTLPGEVKAIVVPHAGYIYSGAVAAKGFHSLDRTFKRVFILASNHARHAPYFRFSVANVSHYETPLGQVRVSPIVNELLKDPLFQFTPQAHTTHIIEVQLPFLQRYFKNADFEIVPIVTGNAKEVDLFRAAEILEPYLDAQTLLVVSSDLSHYHPYDKAVKLDTRCIDALAQLDTAEARRCEACGLPAALIVMELAKRRGWKGTILDYKNSGDTAGSKSEVVGYGAIAYYADKNASKDTIDDEAREALLSLSRKVLTSSVSGRGIASAADLKGYPAVLQKRKGCFVTLEKNHKLRGCIGHIIPQESLVDCVVENTRNAALKDRRFSPVSTDELDDIEIEVSVLSEPVQLAYSDPDALLAQLVPGESGVILQSGFRRATFLPQVWKQLPDKKQFLSRLCRKGGGSAVCWKDPTTRVSTYRVDHFRETR